MSTRDKLRMMREVEKNNAAKIAAHGAQAALDWMRGKKPLGLEDMPTGKIVQELAKREEVTRISTRPGDMVIEYMDRAGKKNTSCVMRPATILIIEREEESE